jgi:hypothetical protein
MKLQHSLLGMAVIALSVLPIVPAHAANLELQVFKAIDAQTEKTRCPDKVTVTETSRPYREGGYTIDGTANLKAIADAFTIASSDDFSVTWVAKLKPQFSRCKGTARVVKSNNEASSEHSHLRMRFVGGQVFLILDMTGQNDANNLTPAIIRKTVRNGNPVWSWGGTD